MRTTAELREGFLSFFEERGHLRCPSYSLVPRAGDDSTLLTTAGMHPQMPFFLGQEPPPALLTTTSQKCFRTVDIDEVGLDGHHLSFFEMLGNFSFGEYFKEDAIAFAWEFVTSKEFLGLDPERLRVTVHYTDDEARAHWREIADLPDHRIYGLGDKDNFWQMGDTGPCGPCSEIYVDLAGPRGGGAAGQGVIAQADFERLAEEGRFLEIWNLVFMQYDRSADGTLTPLPKPSVDTGAGLERIASVLQNTGDNFHTDLFQPLLDKVGELVGTPYPGSMDGPGASYRVLADHARA